MGQTFNALKSEIKNVYRTVLDELREEEKILPPEGKKELREYLHTLSSYKRHDYAGIFIKRKLRELKEKYKNVLNKECIKDLDDKKEDKGFNCWEI